MYMVSSNQVILTGRIKWSTLPYDSCWKWQRIDFKINIYKLVESQSTVVIMLYMSAGIKYRIKWYVYIVNIV